MADIINLNAGPSQDVGPYDARQLARAEQRRARTAKPAQVTLASLRSGIAQLDHGIRLQSSELAKSWRKVRAGDAREHRSEFANRWYWAITVTLVALEVPLNISALKFLRMDSWLHEAAIALFVSGTFFLIAKFTAKMLRQRGWAKRAYREWALALVTNAVLLAALWQIAELRGMLAGNVAAGVTIFTLQIACYLGIVGFTFHHLDPDGDREQLTRLAAVQQQRLKQVWSARAALAEKHNAFRADVKQAIAEIEHDAAERCYEYREYNARHRTEAPPKYFARPITSALFRPLDFGDPVDPHPRSINDIVMPAFSKENGDEAE